MRRRVRRLRRRSDPLAASPEARSLRLCNPSLLNEVTEGKQAEKLLCGAAPWKSWQFDLELKISNIRKNTSELTKNGKLCALCARCG
jgi:hypothetical protein